MLFRQNTLDGIRTGTITLAFRRWKRPTVRAGGTLLTAIGQLSIDAVEAISPASITPADARRAGYPELSTLLDELDGRSGQVYRIALGRLRPDPRKALRSERPDGSAIAALDGKLARMDARAAAPWTHRFLALIRERPGVRAVELARAVGMDRDPFKVNVRKLKALGLTESLEIGYRLSPRGEVLLAARESERGGTR